jgi:hypothetical protein
MQLQADGWSHRARFRRVLAAVALTAVTLALLHTMGWISVFQRTIAVGVPQPEQGRAWIVDISALGLNAASARADRFRLTEDGRPMGRPGSMHDDIRTAGGGRYSVWGQSLYFSTLDGSDPRGNGRAYALIGPGAIPPLALTALGLLLVALLIPDRQGLWRLLQRSLATIDVRNPAMQALAITIVLCFWRPWRILVTSPPWTWSLVTIGLMALALAVAASMPRASFERPVRVVLYTVAALFAFWGATSPLSDWRALGITLESRSDGWLLTFAVGLCISGLVVTIIRPAMAILPILTGSLIWQAQGRALGLPITSMVDFEPVAEVGLFLALSMVAMRSADYASRWFSVASFIDSKRLAEHLLLVAIAVHLSNYLYSGLQKTNLDGGAIYWVLNNPTWLLAYHSKEMGAFPFYGTEALHETSVWLLRKAVVPINVLTLVSQLGSVLAVISLPATMALMIFFDFWHAAVMATTGIFFWKWMALNGCCAWAIARLGKPALWFRLFLPVMVIVAPNYFAVARLGWYDSNALNLVTFWAVKENGDRVRAPSNFFASHSFNAFSNWGLLSAGHPLQARAFASHIYGTVYSIDEQREARQCLVRHESEVMRMLPGFDRLVQVSHRIGLRSPGSHDRHPHHVWSNPFAYQEFKRLDLRSVRSYIAVLEARCVNPVPDPSGRITEPVTKVRKELEITVDAARFL